MITTQTPAQRTRKETGVLNPLFDRVEIAGINARAFDSTGIADDIFNNGEETVCLDYFASKNSQRGLFADLFRSKNGLYYVRVFDPNQINDNSEKRANYWGFQDDEDAARLFFSFVASFDRAYCAAMDHATQQTSETQAEAARLSADLDQVLSTRAAQVFARPSLETPEVDREFNQAEQARRIEAAKAAGVQDFQQDRAIMEASAQRIANHTLKAVTLHFNERFQCFYLNDTTRQPLATFTPQAPAPLTDEQKLRVKLARDLMRITPGETRAQIKAQAIRYRDHNAEQLKNGSFGSMHAAFVEGFNLIIAEIDHEEQSEKRAREIEAQALEQTQAEATSAAQSATIEGETLRERLARYIEDGAAKYAPIYPISDEAAHQRAAGARQVLREVFAILEATR